MKTLHSSFPLRKWCISLLMSCPFLVPLPVIPQSNFHIPDKVLQDGFESFRSMLSLPNVGSFPDQVEQNVQWMEKAFSTRKFTVQRLATPTSPLLLAEKTIKGAEKTVLIYLQVDGQPVDPLHWFQEDPFIPVLKQATQDGGFEIIDWQNITGDFDPEWRIFARSTSDAKGPIAMLLTALDAMKSEGKSPVCNLKVIMDFEEELASPSFAVGVKQHREKLAADMLLILDGPLHFSNRPTLKFGARGIASITLTVYGPKVPQHSGHFGNYAPNPALRLAKLLSSMKDDRGRVTIPTFYDDISLDDKTLKILQAVPDDEEGLKRRLGLVETDKVGRTYQESIQYPSLNIRGMQSAWIKEQRRTIVPATATAEIDIRFVPETDPHRLIKLVRDHIRVQGFHVIDKPPSDGLRLKYPRIATFESSVEYESFRTDLQSEVAQWTSNGIQQEFGEPPVLIRISGGSIPLAPIVNDLGIPAVSVPTVNADNNQHSPNENLRLGNFVQGTRTIGAILTHPF